MSGMGFDVVTNGSIETMVANYGRLPGAIARRYLKAAVRRSIKPMVSPLKAATPRGKTGNLRRSAMTVVRFGKKVTRGPTESFKGTAIGIVGFSRKGSKKNQKGDHSVLVEQGSKPRRRKSGASTGTMPPRHMLRDTLAAKKSGILSNMEIEMGVSLERATQEAARRAAR
jgi:hypothetical protein